MIADYKKTLTAAVALGVLAVSGVIGEPATVQAQSFDRSAAAAAEVRFQQLEKEIRRLTGQIEEQNYEIRRLREELAKVTGDLDVRVKDLEGGGVTTSPSVVNDNMAYTAQPSASHSTQVMPPTDIEPASAEASQSEQPSSFQYNPPGGGGSQTLGTLNRSPNSGAVSSTDMAPRAYDYAYSFVKAREFGRAETEFAKFIQNYPGHPLVANAKYWYGETFYVRGDYEKSARIFAEGYQQFPEGPKAASNLLKLGMALTGMGKTEDACIAFKQLKKDYAKSAVPVLKRAETEMKRINCR